MGQSLFWACGMPQLFMPWSVPGPFHQLIPPLRLAVYGRDFPAATRWGILPNWSEWIAQRWDWKYPLGVVGKAAPLKG